MKFDGLGFRVLCDSIPVPPWHTKKVVKPDEMVDITIKVLCGGSPLLPDPPWLQGVGVLPNRSDV